MGYFRKRWKPNKEQKREFAQKMSEINTFCSERGISYSRNSDSYYFTLNGVDYRVSNHTIAASNKGAYNEDGEQIRRKYHPDKELEDVVYITASKTRLIEIYTNLEKGLELDRRGRVISAS